MSDDMLWFWGVVISTFLFTAILLLGSFFLTMVYGALEESDEEFELLRAGIIYYRNGMWNINVGNAFDENSVVRIRFGWLFRYMFEDFEVRILSEDNRNTNVSVSGELYERVYRRKIRRCR